MERRKSRSSSSPKSPIQNQLFLSKSLLERVCKSDLNEVRELDLSFPSNCDGKLKLIENLELLPKLELLVLRDHALTSIIPRAITSTSLAPSPFAACSRLKDLDLSRNQLVTLDGLQCVQQLERLNVSHNEITSIEAKVFSELHNLQQLRLTFNQIANIHSLLPLTSCLHLSMLSISGNPICSALGSPQRIAPSVPTGSASSSSNSLIDRFTNEDSTPNAESDAAAPTASTAGLPESNLRYLLIFLLPSLELLDGDLIGEDERITALQRWQRGWFLFCCHALSDAWFWDSQMVSLS